MLSDRTEKELMAAIRLSRAPGVGAKIFKELLSQHALPSKALKYYRDNVLQFCSPATRQTFDKSPTTSGIKRAHEFIKAHGTVLYFGCREYPKSLKELNEPPPILFIRGNLPRRPMTAIVGARKAAPEGLSITVKIARKLSDIGIGIISGGAAGIDTAAHEAALEKGGYTVAVFGTGVDVYYPHQNRGLFDKIAQSGALVSELLPGTTPIRSFFPTRNRIVAGLADATILVQAGKKSGALITARHAQKLNRPVFVVKPPYNNESWAGNFELLAQGIPAINSDDDISNLIRIKAE